MKVCLNCQKKFEAKRERAKFCSDLCRAKFNQLSKAGLKIKIYSLVNPIDNKVFYIGRTIGKLETRLKAHIADIKNKSNLKAKIISEILSNDLMPIISTIEEHPCSSEAGEIEINKREDYWISKYKNEGVDLCNVAGVDYEYKSILFFKPKNTTTQRVLIEIDDEVLAKLDKQAQAEKRSRKNYMEVILENAANGNNPIIERQTDYSNNLKDANTWTKSEPFHEPKQLILIRSAEQWHQLKRACENVDEWIKLKEQILEAQNLSEKQKQIIINTP